MDDHDLLIRIDTKQDIFIQDLKQFKSETDKSLEDLWKAVDELRADVQKAKGFISGSKFVWLIIGALPPSVVSVLIGMLGR